jgi:hypothetical protein
MPLIDNVDIPVIGRNAVIAGRKFLSPPLSSGGGTGIMFWSMIRWKYVGRSG